MIWIKRYWPIWGAVAASAWRDCWKPRKVSWYSVFRQRFEIKTSLTAPLSVTTTPTCSQRVSCHCSLCKEKTAVTVHMSQIIRCYVSLLQVPCVMVQKTQPSKTSEWLVTSPTLKYVLKILVKKKSNTAVFNLPATSCCGGESRRFVPSALWRYVPRNAVRINLFWRKDFPQILQAFFLMNETMP